MQATLDGPDGWSCGWVAHGRAAPTRFKRQQGGDGVMIWAGIIGSELVGPFKVEDGVKIDSAGYTQFLEKNLMPWMKKESAAFEEKHGIYAGQRILSCFQIHQRMVSEERHQRRPLDDLATCLS